MIQSGMRIKRIKLEDPVIMILFPQSLDHIGLMEYTFILSVVSFSLANVNKYPPVRSKLW
jgi:hypothetical protein